MLALIAETYEHLNFNFRIVTLNGLIWGLWGGFVAGLLITYYSRTYLGETVRRLLKKEALSPDSALTLSELGIKESRLMKAALKRGKTLRKVISVANPEECEFRCEETKRSRLSKLFPEKEKYTYDFRKMKLYIPEEKKYTADVKYEEKRRISPFVLIALIAVLTAVAIGMTFAVPGLLHKLDGFLSDVLDKK